MAWIGKSDQTLFYIQGSQWNEEEKNVLASSMEGCLFKMGVQVSFHSL